MARTMKTMSCMPNLAFDKRSGKGRYSSLHASTAQVVWADWQEDVYRLCQAGQVPSLEKRIIEAVYDPQYCPPHVWRFLRFRGDKPYANHRSVVAKIMESIKDGVDQDEVS